MVEKIVKFCLVGGSGVIVDMGILFLLADPQMLGWPVVVSKVIAVELAIINNFIWNDFWTFRDRGRSNGTRGRAFRYLKFNAICSAGMLINVLVLITLHKAMGFSLYLSNGIAILCATAWNFTMNYKFAWAMPASGSSHKSLSR